MNTNTYRVKRSRLLLWLAGLVMFTFFGLALVAPEVVDARPDPGVGATLFLGLLTAFAVTMWCCYAVLLVVELGGRLTVSQERIEWTCLFCRRQVNLSQVVEARWRRGRQLRLRTPQDKLTIDFDAYAAWQQVELIRFFRFELPERVQCDWEPFWLQNWVLFDRADPNDPVYLAEQRALRRRFNIYFFVSMVPLCAVFVWQWTSGLWQHDPLFWRYWLTLAVGWPLFWGFIRYVMAPMIVPSGCRPIHRRYPPPAEDRRCWWMIGFLPASFVVLLVRPAIHWAGWPVAEEVVMWTGMAALLVAMLLTAFLVSRRTEPWRREMEAWRCEAARLAEQEYMAPTESS